jgi:tripartite-type tricarboxylate transporter receptor subunit TctC
LPETQEWIVKNGLTPATSQPPDELQRFVNAEMARWTKVLEQIGVARSQ